MRGRPRCFESVGQEAHEAGVAVAVLETDNCPQLATVHDRVLHLAKFAMVHVVLRLFVKRTRNSDPLAHFQSDHLYPRVRMRVRTSTKMRMRMIIS